MRAKNSPERAQKMQKEENRESHRRSQRGIAATKENKISRKATKAQKKRDTKSSRNLSVCHASITRFVPDWAGKKDPRSANSHRSKQRMSAEGSKEF
jgi:hypothetical protein